MAVGSGFVQVSSNCVAHNFYFFMSRLSHIRYLYQKSTFALWNWLIVCISLWIICLTSLQKKELLRGKKKCCDLYLLKFEI